MNLSIKRNWEERRLNDLLFKKLSSLSLQKKKKKKKKKKKNRTTSQPMDNFAAFEKKMIANRFTFTQPFLYFSVEVSSSWLFFLSIKNYTLHCQSFFSVQSPHEIRQQFATYPVQNIRGPLSNFLLDFFLEL